MAKIKHKFGTTYYEKKGRKNKTPIVCLHGGPGGTSKNLRPMLELSDERQVYIYDQIGGGKSSEIEQKLWKIETFVEELDILIKEWGLDEFYLMGGSWGTTLALEYYLRKKNNKIKGLIFQSPMFSAKDWQRDANDLIAKLPKKTKKVISFCHQIGATDSKVYKEAMMEYYSRHVFRNKKKLLERSAKNTNEHGEKVYMHMWGPSEFMATGTLKKYTRVKDLGKISIPTLFICGFYDEARPSTAKKYVAKIKDARLSVIKGASHAILSERPKEMLKVVKKFLD
ncbi:proline iminopeptidase-family hydrolase [Halobacteriovorax sp. HLS]|uniref:proline iminopeptidase-family hydrolase n=1 Tax=Halobacteriovorax sp. HLS TaxID=2234000 RepID=UPI000FD99C22|nr:proline iminopeptidase-family hydrolase [Halobacteriovorax sp. HLS]